MIRHWFKLLWSRRRSSSAIVAEISICFLVLCAVAATGLQQVDRARTPIGFEYEDAYVVGVDFGPYYDLPGEERVSLQGEATNLLDLLHRDPQVRAVAFSTTIPYERGRYRTSSYFEGEVVNYIVGDVTMDADEALGLRVSEGRWFQESDVRTGERPVVLSRSLARFYFGDEPAVGRAIPKQNEEGVEQPLAEGHRAERVVGVVDHYRRLGEYGEPHDMCFRLIDLTRSGNYLSQRMIVRAHPGADASFEEHLLDTLRAAKPEWRFRISSMESQRELLHADQLRLPLIGLVLAAFLILMVGLGLVGVLWQSVSRRTSEFGLRRAVGGSAVSVRGLVLGELVALTSVSALIGTVIFLQALCWES